MTTTGSAQIAVHPRRPARARPRRDARLLPAVHDARRRSTSATSPRPACARCGWPTSRDKTEAAARFVLVLICGQPADADHRRHQGGVRLPPSISHLGISLNTRDEVDQIAALAKDEGSWCSGPAT